MLSIDLGYPQGAPLQVDCLGVPRLVVFLCGGNPRIKKRQDGAPLQVDSVRVPLVGTVGLYLTSDR